MDKGTLTNEIIKKYPVLENCKTKKGIFNLKKKKFILENILDGDYKEKFMNTFKPNTSDVKKNIIIEFNDIELFEKVLPKSKNDISNKKRELIIVNIINDDINIEWIDNYKWFKLSKSIWKYLEENKPFIYTFIKANLIAGRKNNDFNITYENSQTNQNMTIKKEFGINKEEKYTLSQHGNYHTAPQERTLALRLIDRNSSLIFSIQTIFSCAVMVGLSISIN